MRSEYYRLNIPLDFKENPFNEGYQTRMYNVPKTAIEHKEYPVCKCGRKFVPINKGDKICFFCQFMVK